MSTSSWYFFSIVRRSYIIEIKVSKLCVSSKDGARTAFRGFLLLLFPLPFVFISFSFSFFFLLFPLPFLLVFLLQLLLIIIPLLLLFLLNGSYKFYSKYFSTIIFYIILHILNLKNPFPPEILTLTSFLSRASPGVRGGEGGF